MKFYRTVVQVEILSAEFPVGENLSLEEIHREITDGASVGDIRVKSADEVTEAQARKLLNKFGCSPDFFDI